MDFFHREDKARAATSKLLVLFTLCVAILVVAIGALAWTVTGSDVRLQPYQLMASAGAALVTLLIILISSAMKKASLASGGEAVAALVGAVPLSSTPDAPAERQLQNIVEEMAIASGTPMPRVYVLDDPGINAFAAAHTPQDAAIVVSSGALARLSRDELQGVVAHEFSHLLNGDTRLNLKLIGWSFGLLVVALSGRIILNNVSLFSGSGSSSSSRGRDRNGGGAVIAVMALAVALIVIGYLGYFMSQVLKAAVSRQREYLADASSVQFTRNPLGIGGALKKIGAHSYGSYITHDHIAEVSHMFFSDAVREPFFGLLATHPPLESRIRAIDPAWDGTWTEIAPIHPRPLPVRSAPGATSGQALHPVLAQSGRFLPEHVAFGQALLSTFDPLLVAAARVPFSARAVALVAIIGTADDRSQAQRQALAAQDPALAREFEKLWPLYQPLGEGGRLPLLNLSTATLDQLTAGQRQAFLATVTAITTSSGEPPLAEYVLSRLVRARLEAKRLPEVYQSLQPLAASLAVVLGELAWSGASDGAAAEQAFGVAVERLTAGGETTQIPMPKTRASIAHLDAAMQMLVQGSLGIRRRILSACAWCVSADGTVTVREAELLRAIADSFGCPLPPFLDTTGPGTGTAMTTAHSA